MRLSLSASACVCTRAPACTRNEQARRTKANAAEADEAENQGDRDGRRTDACTWDKDVFDFLGAPALCKIDRCAEHYACAPACARARCVFLIPSALCCSALLLPCALLSRSHRSLNVLRLYSRTKLRISPTNRQARSLTRSLPPIYRPASHFSTCFCCCWRCCSFHCRSCLHRACFRSGARCNVLCFRCLSLAPLFAGFIVPLTCAAARAPQLCVLWSSD